ncbi:unnamed protein product (macronuclear) [Paramecium tetraurelia]|uniref:UBZ4-type domain-containing protein n=1 Tax=Paramecium tetraurelia TaxID=5888 RepID=A0BW35_PARTE|nr:uncharacterized protein GSPATT00032604001 [Paramecium tetraurelia]CAK62752.1 unnamed protein product [Paramecium tetraurelia]|eukprot:XP_001430150.1 hypothetical protein (macronuclear) [Paramecium tetraurelia strain d4-2]
MKQFVNPVFQPLDHSISMSHRRTEYIPKIPQPTIGQELPCDFEKIFSSETDISSRLNDSMIQPFDNRNFYIDQSPAYRGTTESQFHNNTLTLTQVVDQKKYNQEIIKYSDDDSLINSSFFGVLNQDAFQKPLQQMDSIYRKLEEPSQFNHNTKNAQTLCDEELRAELQDQVQDLHINNKFISPTLYQPFSQPIQDSSNRINNFNNTNKYSTIQTYENKPIDAYKPYDQNLRQQSNLQQPSQYTLQGNEQIKYNSTSYNNNYPTSVETNMIIQNTPPRSRFVSPTLQKQIEQKQYSEIKQNTYNNSKTEKLRINSPDQFETIKITEIVNVENSQNQSLTSPSPSAPVLPLRHSSFINKNSEPLANKKNSDVYYSQMVQPMTNQKVLQRTIVNKGQDNNEYVLDAQLQQYSRKIQSPHKNNIILDQQSELQSNRTSQQQIIIPQPQKQIYSVQSPTQLPQSPKLITKQQERLDQKELFLQAEKAIKFQRTQPKAILPEWQKQSNQKDTKQTQQTNQTFSKNNGNKQDDLQVLCVICEDLIPFEDVDSHSIRCLAKSKQQAKTQTAHTLILNLNHKLEQLKQNIIIQSKQLGDDLVNSEEIIGCITKIIQCSYNYKKLKQYNELLGQQYQKYQQNFDQKRFIMILTLQRVLAVSQEKQLKLQFVEESQNNQMEDESFLYNELNRLNKQVEIEKANLEQAKLEQELFKKIQKEDLENMKYLRAQYLEQNVDNEVLSQINSEWDVRNPETKTNRISNSIVSDIQYQRDFDGMAVRKEGSSPTIIQNEVTQLNIIQDQKKAFYQLAVQIKLNLPHNHPGKNLLLQDAYEKAVNLKVPKVGWEMFIIEEIRNIQQ